MNLELLRKLEAIDPKNPITLINNCKKATDITRTNIILKGKSVCLFNYFFGGIETDDKAKKEMPSVHELLKLSISKAFIGISQISQNASFLITHLHQNPDKFVDLIIESSKTPEYLYFVQVVVPSIFGFFSSNEHLDLAFNTYMPLIEKAPSNICVDALFPLLNSTCTYRFIEYALTLFFDHFRSTISTVQPGDLVHTVIDFASLLTDCYGKAVPLLPAQVLKILQHMYRNKRDNGCFADLFFVKFLWNQALQWFKTLNVQTEKTLLHRIFKQVGTNKQELSEFYSRLLTAKSIYQLPCLYEPFNILSLGFVVNVGDIILTAKLMDKFSLLPPALSIPEFTSLDKSTHKNVIICQYYMQAKEKEEIKEKIIFTDDYDIVKPNFSQQEMQENMRRLRTLESRYSSDQTNEIIDFVLSLDESKKSFKEFVIYEFVKRMISNSELFEHFIIQKCDTSAINEWFDISCSNEVCLFTPLIDKILSKAQTTEQRNALVENVLNSISNPALKKKLILMNIGCEIKERLSSDQIVFETIDKHWSEHVEQLPNNKPKDKENLVLMNSIDAIRTIKGTPLVTAFDMFQRMINTLSVLPEYDDRYKIFLQTFKALEIPTFLSDFILLNASVMNDYQYSKYFSSKELSNWFLLEKMVSQSVAGKEKLFAAFAQTQEFVTMKMKRVL